MFYLYTCTIGFSWIWIFPSSVISIKRDELSHWYVATPRWCVEYVQVKCDIIFTVNCIMSNTLTLLMNVLFRCKGRHANAQQKISFAFLGKLELAFLARCIHRCFSYDVHELRPIVGPPYRMHEPQTMFFGIQHGSNTWSMREVRERAPGKNGTKKHTGVAFSRIAFWINESIFGVTGAVLFSGTSCGFREGRTDVMHPFPVFCTVLDLLWMWYLFSLLAHSFLFLCFFTHCCVPKKQKKKRKGQNCCNKGRKERRKRKKELTFFHSVDMPGCVAHLMPS